MATIAERALHQGREKPEAPMGDIAALSAALALAISDLPLTQRIFALNHALEELRRVSPFAQESASPKPLLTSSPMLGG